MVQTYWRDQGHYDPKKIKIQKGREGEVAVRASYGRVPTHHPHFWPDPTMGPRAFGVAASALRCTWDRPEKPSL